MRERVVVPEKWEQVKLINICTIQMGHSPSGDTLNQKNSGFPFLQGNAEFATKHPKEQNWTTKPLKIAEKTSLLFSVRAPVGAINIADKDYCIGRGLSSITPKNSSINFLYYLYLYNQKNFRFLSQGSTFEAINRTSIENFNVIVPKSKKEQEKIAEILSEVDSAIEHAQALHVKHQKIKTALMQDLLTHGIDQYGKIRNPKTHAYKPSPLGDIPVEWNTDKLKNIASIIVSNVDKKSFNNEIHVKLCNYMDVYSNTYITNTISFMNATATNAEIRNFQLTQDDVVVTKDSESPFDIGIPAYILTNVENLICGYHLAILRTQKDILLGSWLSSILTIDYYKNYFASTASGSTRFGLPKSALENILVKFPNSKEEQQKIAQILSSHDEKIEKVKTKLEKLKQLKTALMQDLLSGTKRVNHLLGEEQ